MGNFFHGWRREAGCVTLVIACVFMGLWARSYYVEDWLVLPIRSAPTELLSRPSGIAVVTVDGVPPEAYSAHFHWDAFQRDKMVFKEPLARLGKVDWRWDFGGFHFSKEGQGQVIRWYMIPYWSFVIPLTALSAWLLLSKPAKPKQKPVEPPAATGM